MTFAIGIGTVEKGSTAFDGKTQGCSVNLVAGARPAAHSPQPVADFADGESGFPKLALLHNAFCPFRRPALIGGWGGIRTHGTLSGTPVFKTGAFNRSATHPSSEIKYLGFRPMATK